VEEDAPRSGRSKMPKKFPRPSRGRPNNRGPAPNFRSRATPSQQGGGHSLADAKRQYERYLALARAALMNGDDIEAQNFYQHAEHFLRTMREQDATELVKPAN
jgi:Domain of unknown function (DUF4167)